MKSFYVIITIILSVFLLSSCFGGVSTDTNRDTSSDSSREPDTSVGTSSDIHQETDTNTSSNIGGFGSDIEVDSSTNSDTPPPQKELVTVFFDSNGGSEVANIEVELGSPLDAPKATRVGYKFDAWLTEDGEIFDFGEPISSSFTLYASWLPDKVMIYFDANGGNGELEPIEATTESEIVLPTPKFERYGYFFQGWSLDPNGTYDYYGDKEYTVKGEGNTLYAVWGKRICYIRYHLDTGDVVYEPFTYEDLPVITEKETTEYGYCDGWFNATYDKEITEITELKDIDIYQRWIGVHAIGGVVHRVDNIFEELSIPKSIGDNEIIFIDKKAFKNCDKLKSLTLPDTVYKINEYAFEGCTSLDTLLLPSSVTEIGNYAFKDCTSLASLDLPTSLTTLGAGAFLNCVSINEFTMPNSITALSGSTFNGCTGLEKVSFGKDFSKAPTSDFSGCKNLKAINIDPENPTFKSVNGNILSANGKNLLLVAPAKSTIEDAIPDTVTTICKRAFSSVEGLEHLIIPDHVLYLEQSAFDGASSIRTLDTGTLYTIPKLAFANMPSLVSLKINEATKVVGDQAFYNCRTLASVTLVGDFKSFSDTVFEDSNRIFEVFNLTGISGQYYGGVYRNAFSASTTLHPSLIEIYEDFVLYNHRDAGVELISYIGSGDVVSLPYRDEPYYRVWKDAFKHSRTVTEITIPDVVTNIDDYAFDSCAKLKKVTIGKGVIEMSGASFYNCASLSEFILSEENTSYIIDGEAIYTSDRAELVKFIGEGSNYYTFTVEEGVTKIGRCAFLDARVHEISLPSTLTSIGDEAFYKTSISRITIPSAVSYIGKNALNTNRLSMLTFETLADWSGNGGFFSASNLADPIKNAEYFTSDIVKDNPWRRK